MTNNIIKPLIDIRNNFPPVRDQGTRPLCLACATSDAHTYTQNINEHLSAEYLAYYALQFDGESNYDKGLTCDAVISALTNNGQPVESSWPYQLKSKKPVQPPPRLSPLYYAKEKQPSGCWNEISADIQSKQAVVIGVITTDRFFRVKNVDCVIDVAGTNVGKHALVVVGYGKTRNGQNAVLVRNSWGINWGDNGHAWLTEEFISQCLIVSIHLKRKRLNK